jgi:vibriolysin
MKRTFALLGLFVVVAVEAETIHLRPPSPVTASDAAVRQLLFPQPRSALEGAPVNDLKRDVVTQDTQNNRFIRYQQFYKGLKVYGKQVVARTDQANQLRSLTGDIEQTIDLDVKPALTGDQALQKALTEATDVKRHTEPELMVYLHEDKPRLVYMAGVEYVQGGQLHLGRLFVDANTGERVSFKTHIYEALVREIFTLNQRCVFRPSDLPGTFRFTDPLPNNADEHERAAFENAATTYWFYQHFLGRDSIDGQGKAIRISVHGQFPADRQNRFNPCNRSHKNNAFFAGEPVYQMIYGDGDGETMKIPAKGLDVMAHELSHGVTSFTSNLDYENESGALNEAFSDILGATAEAWAQSGGGRQGNPAGGIIPTAETWVLGDGISPNGKMIRYMNNPTQDQHSRDNYDERIKLAPGEQPQSSNDFGGVHSNSGIFNLAFYLLAQGGKHPRGVTEVNVEGIGIDKAARIFYHANANGLFGNTTTFEKARLDLAVSASALYGECSREWRAVHAALDAVKIPGQGEGCPPVSSINLAPSATVTASSEYASDRGAQKAADGNPDTFWVSQVVPAGTSGYAYLTFDWKTEQTISQVDVNFHSDPYKGTVTLYWSDGGQWQGLADKPVKTTRVAVVLSGWPQGWYYAVREVTIK